MSSENPQKPNLGKRISRRINHLEQQIGEKINITSKRSLVELVGVGFLGVGFAASGLLEHLHNPEDVLISRGLLFFGIGVSVSGISLALVKLYRLFRTGDFDFLDPDEKL